MGGREVEMISKIYVSRTSQIFKPSYHASEIELPFMFFRNSDFHHKIGCFTTICL